jgi:molybdopterin-guanine dinucleotide biosynthesis protein A
VPAAIVLAGGSPEPVLAPGLPNKAFLRIGGRPLVVRVTEALRAAASIERILVVGPPQDLAPLLDASCEIVPNQPAIMDNLAAAVARLPGADRTFAIAADLPLVTAGAVDRFVAQCTGEAACYYPIVPQAAIETKFPTARKTYVQLTDGVFTGGSAMLFDPTLLEGVRPFVERLIAGRKKPWLLAQVFGWSTVLKFAAHALSIAEMEAKAAEVIGFRVRAIVLDGPELALDIDAERPENLQALRAALEPPGFSPN